MSNNNGKRGATIQIPIAYGAYWRENKSLDMLKYQDRIPAVIVTKCMSATSYAPIALPAIYLAEQYTSTMLPPYSACGVGHQLHQAARRLQLCER